MGPRPGGPAIAVEDRLEVEVGVAGADLELDALPRPRIEDHQTVPAARDAPDRPMRD